MPTAEERLAGVRAKIERAEHHVNELSALARAFADGNQDCLVAEDDPQTGDKLYRIRFRAAIPGAISLVIGDAAHNLRSSLDHLAWQLVEANGKAPGDRTAFPLTTSRQAFHRAIAKTGIKNGVSASVLNLIEAVQPNQSGYDGLGMIGQINNFDKHRLLVVTTIGIGQIAVDIRPGTPAPLLPDKVPIGRIMTPNHLGGRAVVQDGDVYARIPSQFKDHVHPVLAPEVAFREPKIVEGKSVLPFLADATKLIQRVVNQFVPFL
jgi:hypothetical protein